MKITFSSSAFVDTSQRHQNFDSLPEQEDDHTLQLRPSSRVVMDQLSSWGRQEQNKPKGADTDLKASEHLIRVKKHSVFQRLALVLGLSGSALGILGCKQVDPIPVVLPPAPQPVRTPSPPANSRSYAITERISEDQTDMDWLNEAIHFNISSTAYLNRKSDRLKQITFGESRNSRRFAALEREIDIDGDIDLNLYHWRETYEWPTPNSQPPGEEFLREGRFAFSDWAFEQTLEQLQEAVHSREFHALTPRLLWREEIDEQDRPDLQLSFDLLNSPREHPIALARLADNVTQLLAFTADQTTPEHPQLRAVVRPIWLFLYHILGRINAHYAHETAHSLGEEIEMEFEGERTLNGIPGPALFPKVRFIDDDGILSNQEQDEARELALQAIIAGPNQHTLQNRLMYQRQLMNPGKMSTFDAWTYLIQNNLMPGSAPLGYMMSDKPQEDDPEAPGDINHYRRRLAEKGLELEIDQMIRNKVATLLTNAQSYQAMIALTNEILQLISDLTGMNIGQIPALPHGMKILGADVHWPSVEHYLTNNGEILHITLPVNALRTYPVTAEFSTDLDHTQPRANVNTLRGGLTIGYRHEWFLVEAGGALSTHREEPSELRSITGIGRLTIPLRETGVSVSLQLAHQRKIHGEDPMNKIFGIEEGTNATIILNLEW